MTVDTSSGHNPIVQQVIPIITGKVRQARLIEDAERIYTRQHERRIYRVPRTSLATHLYPLYDLLLHRPFQRHKVGAQAADAHLQVAVEFGVQLGVAQVVQRDAVELQGWTFQRSKGAHRGRQLSRLQRASQR